MVSANESVRIRLEEDPNSKWGFLIYRCTYKSQDKWNRFMEYFKALVRIDLVRNDLSDCYSRLDWRVEEDPAYEGIMPEQART